MSGLTIKLLSGIFFFKLLQDPSGAWLIYPRQQFPLKSGAQNIGYSKRRATKSDAF
jgi:hypothetical protein